MNNFDFLLSFKKQPLLSPLALVYGTGLMATVDSFLRKHWQSENSLLDSISQSTYHLPEKLEVEPEFQYRFVKKKVSNFFKKKQLFTKALKDPDLLSDNLILTTSHDTNTFASPELNCENRLDKDTFLSTRHYELPIQSPIDLRLPDMLKIATFINDPVISHSESPAISTKDSEALNCKDIARAVSPLCCESIPFKDQQSFFSDLIAAFKFHELPITAEDSIIHIDTSNINMPTDLSVMSSSTSGVSSASSSSLSSLSSLSSSSSSSCCTPSDSFASTVSSLSISPTSTSTMSSTSASPKSDDSQEFLITDCNPHFDSLEKTNSNREKEDVVWVPAHLHPELHPLEFRKWLDQDKNVVGDGDDRYLTPKSRPITRTKSYAQSTIVITPNKVQDVQTLASYSKPHTHLKRANHIRPRRTASVTSIENARPDVKETKGPSKMPSQDSAICINESNSTSNGPTGIQLDSDINSNILPLTIPTISTTTTTITSTDITTTATATNSTTSTIATSLLCADMKNNRSKSDTIISTLNLANEYSSSSGREYKFKNFPGRHSLDSCRGSSPLQQIAFNDDDLISLQNSAKKKEFSNSFRLIGKIPWSRVFGITTSTRSHSQGRLSSLSSSSCSTSNVSTPTMIISKKVARSIYKSSHQKMSNARRPLYQQVMISNLMLSYLSTYFPEEKHKSNKSLTKFDSKVKGSMTVLKKDFTPGRGRNRKSKRSIQVNENISVMSLPVKSKSSSSSMSSVKPLRNPGPKHGDLKEYREIAALKWYEDGFDLSPPPSTHKQTFAPQRQNNPEPLVQFLNPLPSIPNDTFINHQCIVDDDEDDVPLAILHQRESSVEVNR